MTYRDFTIERATFGHYNVSKGDGFCGGFKTLAAAKDWIDGRYYTVTREGEGYRVTMIPGS